MSAPVVLFVCVKNAGKSQMAAALMRVTGGDRVRVHSAGTAPGSKLNQLSADVLAEVGASVDGEYPKPIDANLVATADRVVIVGGEAALDVPPGTVVERWVTDEPSSRGIDGIDRMRLVRDDIARRVDKLVEDLGVGG